VKHRILRLNPKIKIVHILSCPTDAREIASVLSISRLIQEGFSYVQRKIPPYRGLPPRDFCATPEFVSEQVGILNGKIVPWTLGPGAYGCYLSHREVLESEFTSDLDGLLVCECDCLIRMTPYSFARAFRRYAVNIVQRKIAALSIGGWTDPGAEIIDGIVPCLRILETHCMYYSAERREYILEKFRNIPWDNYDLWCSSAFGGDNALAVSAKRIAIQGPGKSLNTNAPVVIWKEWSPFAFLQVRKLPYICDFPL
jgi:hypothetical protein